MGILQQAGNFLGIEKFGQGLASAGRVLSGGVNQDIGNQVSISNNVQKLTYAAKREQDPEKKRRLLQMAQSFGTGPSATEIDPGLNLSNKEVLGSAANVALNVATPGAFKGGKAAVLGKNAALGGAFGLAQGLEKDRSGSGLIGSTVGGAAIGAGVGGIGLMGKALSNFIGKKVPTHIMNKAVKPALADLKKNVRFGTKTLGEELLDEGVKGGPQKLLHIADDKLVTLEDELQRVLTDPNLKEARIPRDKIYPYLREMMEHKKLVPGGRNDMIKIKEVYSSLPEEMTLSQANEIKRAIYKELREPAFKLDANLTTRAQSMKQIAKGLKTEIENTVGGTVVSDINKKLSIYGRMENAIVDQMAREMRNNGIGLTDAMLLGAGDFGWLALLRHVGQNANTHVAQGLSKAGGILAGQKKVGDNIATRVLKQGSQGVKSVAKRAALNLP